MSDIVERLIEHADQAHESGSLGWRDTMNEAAAEIEKLRAAYSNLQNDVQQTLGKVLGYPWFKDDQKNFPGATEDNGVCVGDHVAESIAVEAAAEIEKLQADWETARDAHDRRAAEVVQLRAALREIVDVGEKQSQLICASSARAALGGEYE